jgi:hypothetical protein
MARCCSWSSPSWRFRVVPHPRANELPGRPLSLVIDGEGIIRECVVGGREYEFFEEKVRPYLS